MIEIGSSLNLWLVDMAKSPNNTGTRVTSDADELSIPLPPVTI